jgi:hypothetical protein
LESKLENYGRKESHLHVDLLAYVRQLVQAMKQGFHYQGV